PLMMSIVTLAYRGMSPDDLRQFDRLEDRRRHVFGAYLDQMLKRRGEDARYPVEKVRRWLTWLAQQMSRHEQSVFQLEGLQPDWLSASQQRRYDIGVRLLVGVAGGLGIALSFALAGWLVLLTILRPMSDIIQGYGGTQTELLFSPTA